MGNVEQMGGWGHVSYLDDFFFSGLQCKKDLEFFFLALCGRINIPMNMEKTLGPVTRITMYGIEKCKRLVHQCKNRKKVTLRELQSLIGVLNFTFGSV
jgi:hypothetical protein